MHGFVKLRKNQLTVRDNRAVLQEESQVLNSLVEHLTYMELHCNGNSEN